MPFYEYECRSCGTFEDWQPMSRCSEPMDCPSCGMRSKRAISAPNLALMNPHTRIAHQRNEKSAHEPQFVQKKPKQHDGKAGHSHAHGHCHGHGHSHGHGHGASRPWMIGH